MQPHKNIKVILSGGGTGGHIFPATAIANAIKLLHPSAEILFIGAKGRMEMEKVPAAGYPIIGLNISGLQRRLTAENLLFPFKTISSFYKAWKIIRKFNPDVVIGTGGYASGPTLFAASHMNIPTLIQEQNSYPGITNKMLAKKTNIICVAYPEMDKYFPPAKLKLLGNPIREQIEYNKITQTEGLQSFNLNPDKTTVLVIGGSLGARTINQSIVSGLEQLKAANIQLIWQTGKAFATEAEKAINSISNSGFYTSPFITEMDKAYSAADIVVSRAGAIAVSELCISRKASILIPSPNVAEDHQTKNASALVQKNAAIMVTDAEANKVLIDTIIELAINPDKQKTLKNAIGLLAYPAAAHNIAVQALELIKQPEIR